MATVHNIKFLNENEQAVESVMNIIGMLDFEDVATIKLVEEITERIVQGEHIAAKDEQEAHID